MPSTGVPKRIQGILRLIYSKEAGDKIFRNLKNLMDFYRRSEAVVQRRKKYRDPVLLVVINVSDDMVMLPEYSGRLDMITKTPFYGRVDPYGVYFLQ